MNTPAPDQAMTGQLVEVESASASPTTIYEEPYLPSYSTVTHWLKVADYLRQAGITPKALDTPQKVLGAWLKGKEMKIPPMLALQHIYIVDGKAGISAELQIHLCRRAGIQLEVIQQNDDICVVQASRKGPDEKWRSHTDQFTFKEAVNANLANKFNWRNYRRDMLRARATTRVLRFFAPDVTHGCMLDDEVEEVTGQSIGAPVPDAEARPVTTAEEPKRVLSPSVTSSSRESTGDTRVRGPRTAQTEEPEAGAEAGDGERAEAGGDDSEAAWRPGPECFGKGGKPKGIADARRLEGWRAFVTGTALDDFPRQLGDRVIAWWKEGWRAADAMSADATVTAGETDGDDEQLNFCREGALSFIDGNTIKDCPYESGSEARFFFMTGYQAAAMAAPSDEEAAAEEEEPEEAAPAEEAPAEEEPAEEAPAEDAQEDPKMAKGVREGAEATIAAGFESLGFTPEVARDVIKRRYDTEDLASLTDGQVKELDRLLGETLNGDNDGTWMDP